MTDAKGEFRIETLKGTQFVMHAVAPGYHAWFGTPTSGDVLRIVLEPKQPPRAPPGGVPPARVPVDGAAPARPDAAGPPATVRELESAAGLPAQRFAAHDEMIVLGRIGEDARAALPVLIRLLESPDWAVRGAAMDALVRIGPTSPEATNALAERFDDPRAVYK